MLLPRLGFILFASHRGLCKRQTEQGQVLTAQRGLLAAEQEMADATTNVALNLVQLYRALGGGWDPATAAPARAPART